MLPRTLPDRHGIKGGHAPAVPVRGRAATVLVLLLAAVLVVLGDPRPAQAFVPAPLPVFLPGSLAALAPATAGVGAAVGTAGTATAVAGGAVALAPVAVAAGAVLAGAAALYVGWRWLDGHDPTYADPAASTENYLNTQVHVGYPFDDTYVEVTGPHEAVPGCAAPCYLFTGHNLGHNTSAHVELRRYDADGNAYCCKLTAGYHSGGTDSAWEPVKESCGSTDPSCTGLAGKILLKDAPSTSTAEPGTTTVTTTPTSRCSDGSTVAGQAIVYTGATPSEDLPPILAPACPAGTQRVGLTAPSVASDGTVVPDPLTWTAPAVPDAYVDCRPGGAAAPCQVTLVKVGPDGRTVNCTGTLACPTPRTGPDPDGSTYRCTWGPYPLPLADCDVVPTHPPVPRTEDGPCVVGWSWNPVDWVLEPVKCALTWAFVPSTAPLAQAELTAGQLAAAAPFGYVTGVVGWVGDLDAGSECFTLNVQRADGPLQVLSTCTPGHFERALQSHRALLEVAMYAGFFLPVAWWAWRQYAPGSQGVS
jgi:hypothetical protein